MLFDHGLIITVDPERRIIEDGAIAVSGNVISQVGPRAEVMTAVPDAEVVDLRGMIVTPGFVNTHVHLSQCLIRGCGDDLALPEWVLTRTWPTMGSYSEEDARCSAELCILEMLRSGTTTFLETFLAGRHNFNGVADAVCRSGIRAAIAKLVMDIPTYTVASQQMHPGMIEDGETSLRTTVEMHERWHGAGNDRIRVWFGPRPPGGSSERLFTRMMSLAREHGIRVNMHLAEEASRVQYIRDHYDGATPAEFCERVGMLGGDVLLVHCVNLVEDADIKTVAATGTHISHNPPSNSKMGMGIAPIPRFLDAGINVALGTDGGPCNNTYDMVRDLRWASYLHKAVHRDPTIMPSERVLEMATIDGARALGLEDQIGSIEVGKKADFVAFDTNRPHLTPSPDPVSTIVCCATGQDVNTVVVDGQTVVSDGQVLTLDSTAIMVEARERSAAVYRRAGVDVSPRWPVISSARTSDIKE